MKLLIHAARLLEAEAKIARDSCAGTEELWACGGDHCQRSRKGKGKCPAHRRHDDQMATAKKLRQAAS